MHMAQVMPLPLTVSCSSKIQIGFTFLVPAYPGCRGKEAVKWLLLNKYSTCEAHNLKYFFKCKMTQMPQFCFSNLPCLQVFPIVAFLFFFRTDSMDSPDCLRPF